MILIVTEKPPEYSFTQKLPPKYGIQRKKEGMLECFVSDTKAKVKWYKDGKQVEVSALPWSVDINTVQMLAM